MHKQPGRRLILIGGLFEGGLGVLAGLIGWLFAQEPWRQWSWNLQDAALGIVASLPMLLFFILCVRWPIGPMTRIKEFADEVIRPLFAQCSLLDLVIISLLAGIGEEMLFRGLIQELLARWLGPGGGLLSASVLFGLMHPITVTYVFLATGFGIYLGAIWLQTDNLLVVAVAHGLYDFLALLYLTRKPAQSEVL